MMTTMQAAHALAEAARILEAAHAEYCTVDTARREFNREVRLRQLHDPGYIFSDENHQKLHGTFLSVTEAETLLQQAQARMRILMDAYDRMVAANL